MSNISPPFPTADQVPTPTPQPDPPAPTEPSPAGTSAGTSAPTTPTSDLVSAERTAAGQAILAMATHAGKAGPTTTEFWFPFVGPVVAFLVALGGSWAVTHGIVANDIVSQVVPPSVATISGGVTAWLARNYTSARTALKAEMVRLLGNHLPTIPS